MERRVQGALGSPADPRRRLRFRPRAGGLDAAVALVGVVLAVVAWQAPRTVAETARRLADEAARARLDRAVAPARSVDISVEALAGAQRLIPPDATYAIAIGETQPLLPVQREALPPLAAYWLLPRRYTPSVHDAEWVIAYAHPTETLGVAVADEAEVAEGTVVARVVR